MHIIKKIRIPKDKIIASLIKKWVIILIILPFFSFITIFPKIYEIDSLRTIEAYIGSDAKELVLFDIDDTLIRGIKEEATHQWFCKNMEKLLKSGLSPTEAKKVILPTYIAAQRVTRVQLIDEDLPAILNRLRLKNVSIAVITLRGQKLLIDATFRQFADVGISFCNESQQWQRSFKFAPLTGDTYYRDGILFCDGNNKAKVLKIFFDTIDYHPTHIVYVDDDRKNIESIEQLAHELQIRFDGFYFLRVAHGLVKKIDDYAVL